MITETHSKVPVIVQSGLFLLLLVLLMALGKGQSPFLGALSLMLLIGCHLVAAFIITSDRSTPVRRVTLFVSLSLLLCTLVVWTTRASEESPFWIVFFLPIIIAASHLRLRGTLVTCGVALLLFASHLPPRMYLDPKDRLEEMPEQLGFVIMFFLVGVLVQAFAEQNRRQLALQRQLNEKLLENQQHLKDSLARLEAAEASLRTKERLASLGEMSAGIAHEIRNPLGIISSSAQLLDREVANADARQLLEIIKEESTRLNGLITEFLTFGRQLEPQRQPCDLAGLVQRTLDSLQSAAEQKHVGLAFDLQCDPCEADIDADMIQQVLLNLLLNALDATSSGGRIKITLRQQPTQLEIIVSDSGSGMPPEVIAKVFDPFFTTKSGGTGLGLANAYKIMESHGGSLDVVSCVGEGTTFTAAFPLENS